MNGKECRHGNKTNTVFFGSCQREHITEAADALHVAQSSVSRQIFNLEAELGVELFIREGRSVKLTPLEEFF